MMIKKRKQTNKLRPMQNWFNLNPPKITNFGNFMQPASAPLFRISAPSFMSKNASLAAIKIPQRMESNRWLPMVRTPKRPVSYFWGDTDNDGVYNGLDCQPNNPFKQGSVHDENAPNEKKKKIVLNKLLTKIGVKKAKRGRFEGTAEFRARHGIEPPIGLPVGKLAKIKPTEGYRFKKVINIEKGKEKRSTTVPSSQFVTDMRKLQRLMELSEARKKLYDKFTIETGELNEKHTKEFYDKQKKNIVKTIRAEKRKTTEVQNKEIEKVNEIIKKSIADPNPIDWSKREHFDQETLDKLNKIREERRLIGVKPHGRPQKVRVLVEKTFDDIPELTNEQIKELKKEQKELERVREERNNNKLESVKMGKEKEKRIKKEINEDEEKNIAAVRGKVEDKEDEEQASLDADEYADLDINDDRFKDD